MCAKCDQVIKIMHGDQVSDLVSGDIGFQVVKSVPERRYTLGVAYPANKVDVAVAADGHRDFVSPGVLEEAAWAFMRKGANIGLKHMRGTDGAGQVVESYIWRAEPWVIKAADGSTQTVMPGDWLTGLIWPEPTWEAIKRGEYDGLSPQGGARRGQPSAESLKNLR